MTSPTTETPVAGNVDLAALVAECVAAEEMAEHWANQVKAIKEKLASLPVGVHEAGLHMVQVRAGARRFDAKAAADAYPMETNPAFYTPTFDRKNFERLVAPAVVDQFKVEGQPTVVVK